MGKRFLEKRYDVLKCGHRAMFFRMNEGDMHPRKMRPYGSISPKFSYDNMFQKKNASRPGNKRVQRTAKKAARHYQIEE